VLPPDAAKMIVDFDTHLLKDAYQWGAEVERGLEHIGSYMDPRLRFSRRSYLNFIGDLFRGSSWADVVMDADSDMYLSLSDVKDYFYACGLPPGLESFFCLPDITGEELKVVTRGDPSFGHLWGSVAVAPAMRVMPMGWTWSFFFAQVLHVHQVHQIRPWVSGAVMQDRVPPPPFRAGTELVLPCCDNYVAAASSPAQADALREDSKRRMTSLGFEVHEEEAARHWAESLGFAIDGLTGEHRPSPAKAWRLRQVCRRMSRQRPWLSGRQLERLLGHATFQFLGHRPLLSIFRSCYTFVQCHYLQPRRLWRTAAEELRAAAALLPFARANMRRPWASEVEVFDASPAGCGIMTATLSKDVVSEIGKVDERWRYAFQCEQPGGPREYALRSAPPVEECFSNAETVLPRDWSRRRWQPVQDFPEVPASMFQDFDWRECVAGRWRDEEHITMLEGRSGLISVRRTCRSLLDRGKRHLKIGDSLGMILAFAKGRADNFGLLMLCRKNAALTVAMDMTIRWITAAANEVWPVSSFVEARAWGRPRLLARVRGRLLPPTQAKLSHGEASAGLPRGPAGSRPAKGPRVSGVLQAPPHQACSAPREVSRGLPPPTHRCLPWAASARALPANAGWGRGLQTLARQARARTRPAAVKAGDHEMQEELELKGIMVSLLEMKSVGRQSIPYYLQKFKEFLDFVVAHVFDLHKDEDVGEVWVQLMDLMYFDGWPADQGGKLLAAVKLGIPRFSRAGLGGLPLAARALGGFLRAAPVACRLGLPQAWVVAYIAAMLWRGRLESARRVLVMHDAYLRTGEATRLRAEDFVPPIGDRRGHERGVLTLGSSSVVIPTETGVLDDAVALSDWDFRISKVLGLLKDQRAPHEALFVTKPAAVRKDFDQAFLDLGPDRRNLASCQLRRSEPSRDALLGRRTLPDIMKRGRSVKRYERDGVLQKALAGSPKELLDLAVVAESSIAGALH
ncbi:unnamed protein product, partial [Prorocentrum cordatum]